MKKWKNTFIDKNSSISEKVKKEMCFKDINESKPKLIKRFISTITKVEENNLYVTINQSDVDMKIFLRPKVRGGMMNERFFNETMINVNNLFGNMLDEIEDLMYIMLVQNYLTMVEGMNFLSMHEMAIQEEGLNVSAMNVQNYNRMIMLMNNNIRTIRKTFNASLEITNNGPMNIMEKL
jgi:hypothetical protein